MTNCTLIIRAFAFIYGEDGYSQVIKRRAYGTLPGCRFPELPRIGETLRLTAPQSKKGTHDFTVKGVTHEMEERGVVGYEIDLGAGGIMEDQDAFDKGVARWRAMGFDVIIKDQT
jgi:hypothetical protein